MTAGGTDPRLPWRHALLALAVVAVWGTNFVIIKVALSALPPLLLGVLRFGLALLPAVLFIPRPAVPWHDVQVRDPPPARSVTPLMWLTRLTALAVLAAVGASA